MNAEKVLYGIMLKGKRSERGKESVDQSCVVRGKEGKV